MDRELRIYPMWAPSMLVGGPYLLEGSLTLLLPVFFAEPFGILLPIEDGVCNKPDLLPLA